MIKYESNHLESIQSHYEERKLKNVASVQGWTREQSARSKQQRRLLIVHIQKPASSRQTEHGSSGCAGTASHTNDMHTDWLPEAQTAAIFKSWDQMISDGPVDDDITKIHWICSFSSHIVWVCLTFHLTSLQRSGFNRCGILKSSHWFIIVTNKHFVFTTCCNYTLYTRSQSDVCYLEGNQKRLRSWNLFSVRRKS